MMSIIGTWALPVLVCIIVVFGLVKGVNVFDCFIEGAKDGMKTMVNLLPSLVGLVVAVAMMRNSGALDILIWLMTPITKLTGIPAEVMPLAILSPISGSGALSMYESIMNKYGVDNYLERVSSVMMGSSETTFYAVTVYYGSVNVKKTRHTIPSALCADLTSVIMSSWAVRWFF